MARGRHQKWVCKNCKQEFSIQNAKPKLCCYCGSDNLGRAPSYELAVNFDEKRKELEEVCKELNPVYLRFTELRERHRTLMNYWKQQKNRGYISKEEYEELASLFNAEKID